MNDPERIGGLLFLRELDNRWFQVYRSFLSLPVEEQPIVEVQSELGFRMRGPIANDVVRHFLHRTDSESPYEYPILFLLLVLTYDGGTFLDIGANLGYHSLAVLKNGPPTLHAYAFEPLPYFYRLLCANIELNGLKGRITPHPVAVSDRAGEADLHLLGTASSLEVRVV
ncbi:MAG: hypothetical protein KatS3mg115_1960 [Candidatus Poribacteria bacterium]|nr:MAG: hypothetical protein KatS3mg115_1960 [Candidatus Poribacteria bacterium]